MPGVVNLGFRNVLRGLAWCHDTGPSGGGKSLKPVHADPKRLAPSGSLRATPSLYTKHRHLWTKPRRAPNGFFRAFCKTCGEVSWANE